MKKKIAAAVVATLGAASAFAQTTAQTAAAAPASALGGSVKYLAAALAVSVAAVAGGVAVAKIGSAAMGAMAEKPELSGKALPYVGLAEGICLWGILVALLILLL